MASHASVRPDFSTIPAEAIKELHRQSEVCLQGTVQLALAVDQRAITLTGILGAGSVALAAATVTMISSAQPNPALIGAAAVTALLLFLGAMLCAWAARPSSFHVAGYEPKRMAKSALNDTWILRYATEDAQVRIDSNRLSLQRASRTLALGMCIAIAALPLGFSAFFALSAPSNLRFFETGRWGQGAAVVLPAVAEDRGSVVQLAAAPSRAERAD
jgi:hypothetical protein